MKMLLKRMALLTIIAVCCRLDAGAQVHIQFNIETQPAWGPSGYDRADYYYLPDINAYYDIPRSVFVYRQDGMWRTASSLPPRFGNIDLYRVHKVVLNNVHSPWNQSSRYYKQYHSYAGRRGQIAIRDSREQKYWQNPGHPEYNRWKREHHNNQDHGHSGNGDGRGH